MAYVKVQKSKAYFKRYQVKFKRRRQGKTDYYQRKRLIWLDKDKFNASKYRLIVRITNKQVICQLAHADINHDRILCQANSKELPRYGVKVGLANYAAAYATGLLLARRHLTINSIADKHTGCTDPSKVGEDIDNTEAVEGRRTFKAVLDIGLARASTGAKVFGAMKGALDGGLNIPHSPGRFVGNNKETKEYNPDVHREHIFGLHVARYMKELQEKDDAAYQRQFSDYIKAGVTSQSIEEMYKKAHELIRADPSKAPKKERESKPETPRGDRKVKRRLKVIRAKRRNKIEMKKARIMTKLNIASA